jgi:hypothetical protein
MAVRPNACGLLAKCGECISAGLGAACLVRGVTIRMLNDICGHDSILQLVSHLCYYCPYVHRLSGLISLAMA